MFIPNKMIKVLFWLFIILLVGMIIVMSVLAANWSYWNMYINSSTILSTSAANSIRTISALCTIFVIILVLVLAFGIFMFYRHLNYLIEVERAGDFAKYMQNQNMHRREWEHRNAGIGPPGYVSLITPSPPLINTNVPFMAQPSLSINAGIPIAPVQPVNLNVDLVQRQ
jgi:hypothetical protein